jgi:hypothetical protein
VVLMLAEQLEELPLPFPALAPQQLERQEPVPELLVALVLPPVSQSQELAAEFEQVDP